MSEEWRAIADFPGYEVSNEGRVRSWRKPNSTELSKTPKLLKPHRGGLYLYARMRLGKVAKSVSIHRLVALAFLELPPGVPDDGSLCWNVAHGNGNPEDNRLCNLRWATSKENAADKLIHGTQPFTPGNKKRDPEMVRMAEEMRKVGTKYKYIASHLGVSVAHAWEMCNGFKHV